MNRKAASAASLAVATGSLVMGMGSGCASSVDQRETVEQTHTGISLGTPADSTCPNPMSTDGTPLMSCSIGPGCAGGQDTAGERLDLNLDIEGAGKMDLSGETADTVNYNRCATTEDGSGSFAGTFCLTGWCGGGGGSGTYSNHLWENVNCSTTDNSFSCGAPTCQALSTSIGGYLEVGYWWQLGKWFPVEFEANAFGRIGGAKGDGSSYGSGSTDCCSNGATYQSHTRQLGVKVHGSVEASVKLVKWLHLDVEASAQACGRLVNVSSMQCDGTPKSENELGFYVGVGLESVGVSISDAGEWEGATVGLTAVENEPAKKQICVFDNHWCFTIPTFLGAGNPEACNLSEVTAYQGPDATEAAEGADTSSDSTYTPLNPAYDPNGSGSDAGSGSGGYPSPDTSPPPGDPEWYSGNNPPGSTSSVPGAPAGWTGTITPTSGSSMTYTNVVGGGSPVDTPSVNNFLYFAHQYIPALGGTLVCVAGAPWAGWFTAGNLWCYFRYDSENAYRPGWYQPSATLRDICQLPNGGMVIYTPGTIFAKTDGRPRCLHEIFNGTSWVEAPPGACSCDDLSWQLN
ncbi:MAG TPA: hypothetical protein VF765_37550 [Polyangiaceae bacterium]